MSIAIDDIAPPSGESWKPEIGDTAKGTIIYAGKTAGESYDRSRVEQKLRIDLEDDTGQVVTIWATTNTDVGNGGWAKRDAKAIAAAVRKAGERTLEIGGTLALKRVDDVATDRGPAKAFVAQYQPPTHTQPADDAGDGAVDDLF